MEKKLDAKYLRVLRFVLNKSWKGGWFVLFYGVSTLSGSFNAELSNFGLVWFYVISIILGYLMPNPFLYINTVAFQTIQFSISSQFSSI